MSRFDMFQSFLEDLSFEEDRKNAEFIQGLDPTSIFICGVRNTLSPFQLAVLIAEIKDCAKGVSDVPISGRIEIDSSILSWQISLVSDAFMNDECESSQIEKHSRVLLVR